MTTRRFTVRRDQAGQTVLDWLRARLALSPSNARRMLRERQVRVGGVPWLNPTQRLRAGQHVEVDLRPPRPQAGRVAKPDKGPRLPPDLPPPVVRYADAEVVVVEKPAGLTTMRHAEEAAEFGQRARRYLPPTLADLLPTLLAKGKPGRQPPVRAVHRIDKETSGLVVFARTATAEGALGRQFRAHGIDRRYLALVRGRARPGRIESWLVRDRGDGRRGSAATPGEGQHAVTHVRVVEELGDYTFIECRLETGRTHQVRIHLGEAGTPLCGERVYDRPLHGKPLPDGSGAHRVMLHAASLGFDHPATSKRMQWTSPLPRAMADLLKRLRRQAARPRP
jgi:23S rRNA pseudouridine1911/1915/1917 synthase